MERYKCFVLLLYGLVLLSCSEKMGGEQDAPDMLIADACVVLPSEKAEIVVSIDARADWSITNSTSWAAISPLKGSAGRNAIKFRTVEENDSLRERVAYFDMRVGDELKRYYLIQEGKKGVEIISSEYVMGDASGGCLHVEVLSNTEFSIQSQEQWLTVSHIEYNKDSTALEYGIGYSALQKAIAFVDVSENPNNTQREVQLAVVSGNDVQYVSVIQFAKLTSDVDWNGKFYKKTLGLKFTGQSCQNCPMMAENFHKAQERRPERFEILNMHGYQKTDELYYDNAAVFRDYYGVSGFPYGIFNSMVNLENEVGLVDKIEPLIDEALMSPAKTAISMNSVWDGTVLSLDGFIAVREDLDYKIHIFVLENDIIASQNGGSSDYEHDAVLRYAVTDDLGDVLAGVKTNTVVQYSKSIQLPAGVFYNGSADNAYLLIFTTYAHKGIPDGIVSGVEYYDYGMIVDNVAVLPFNSQITFEYEE